MTPETDAQVKLLACGSDWDDFIHSDFARTLERERDEWRKKAVDLHKKNLAMECAGIALKSMCAAAAAEIEEQWEAHCDGEGYGPANLMYRLKGQSPPDLYSAHVTHEERSKWMKWHCTEILTENAIGDSVGRERPVDGA